MLEQAEHVDVGTVEHGVAEGEECDVFPRIQERKDLGFVRLPCARIISKVFHHWKHLVDNLDVLFQIGACDFEGDAALLLLGFRCDEDICRLDRLDRLDGEQLGIARAHANAIECSAHKIFLPCKSNPYLRSGGRTEQRNRRIYQRLPRYGIKNPPS